MKTNLELVRFAERALAERWGYCLGTFGNILTPTLLNQKMAQGYGVGSYNKRHQTYLKTFTNKRVSDCYGLVKGFVWWREGASPKYNSRQDRNQEGAYSAAREKGRLNTMPEIPGLVLWMRGHAGIYIGDGKFIECVGAPVGMRKGRIHNGVVISGSKFTHWFKDTYIQYLDKSSTGKLALQINGRVKYIDGFIKTGISYAVIGKIEIPLRTLGEGLGFKVGWDNTKKMVIWNE